MHAHHNYVDSCGEGLPPTSVCCDIAAKIYIYIYIILPIYSHTLPWLQEYEAYYYVKFKKAPKITKKLSTAGDGFRVNGNINIMQV